MLPNPVPRAREATVSEVWIPLPPTLIMSPVFPQTLRPDVLMFHCGHCSAELSVPVELAGVEGPCPCCGVHLKAPAFLLPASPPPPALSSDFGEDWAIPPRDEYHALPAKGLGYDSPPPREEEQELPESWDQDHGTLRAEAVRPRGMEMKSNPNFSARLAIAGEEAGDTSQRPVRRRDKARNMRRRLRKMDRSASRVMESDFYRIARLVLLLLLGGTAAGLFLYMKNNDWTLRKAPVKTEVTAPALPRHSVPSAGR